MTRRGTAAGSPGSVLDSRVPPRGVLDRAAGGLGGGGRVVLVPVGRPLPHVAGHLEQPVAVGRERLGRRRVLPPVGLGVVVGEVALPHIGHVAAAGRELLAPHELGGLQAAPGRPFPLGLGRQILAGPGGVRLDVGPGHMHHRVISEAADRALRPAWVPPVGARHPRPPRVGVVERHRPARFAEHRRGRHQHLGERPRVVGGFGHLLGHRDVPGLLHEAGELVVGHRAAVHPESTDGHEVRRGLLGIVVVGPHPERAARNPHHARGRGRSVGRGRVGAVGVGGVGVRHARPACQALRGRAVTRSG